MVDGGYLDGHAVIRIRDIARMAPDESVARDFARTRPEWPPTLPEGLGPDLDHPSAVLMGLVRPGELLGIRKENERDALWIGTVDGTISRHIYLHEIRPDATWHPAPLGYRLRAITRADVGTRYQQALSAIGGTGPEAEAGP